MKQIILFISICICIFPKAGQSQFSVQKALIEVFTGAWSQYATDGFVLLDTVLAQHPDAIAVNLHNGDDMEISEGVDLATFYAPSYPQALINRSGSLYSRSIWNSQTSSVLANAASVTVSFDSVKYNLGSRQIDVYLKALFTGPVSGDLRFNCIVVEDSVVGTGIGYNQENYYNTVPGHAYYGAGDPIIGLPHRYVARDFLGDTWGTSGIIPASVVFGDSYTYHYSYILPAQYNESKISLVGLVCQYNGSGVADRIILNAEEWPELVQPPTALFSAATNELCKWDQNTYSDMSTNATSWSWIFQGGTPSASSLQDPGAITYTVPGSYITTLTVTNAGGSSTWSDTIAVDSVDVSVIKTPTQLVAVASPATYQWLDCDDAYAPIPGETEQFYVLTQNGRFAVSVTQNGCTDTSVCYIVYDLGFPEIEKENISIFPNPSDGHFLLKVEEMGRADIYNSIGCLLSSMELKPGENEVYADLVPGSYILKASTENSVYLIRLFIVE